jgi:ribonuclease HII
VKASNIVGIDEVGRGPIAGPVAVCAFVCKDDFFDSTLIDTPLRDSKKLSKIQRERWFEFLKIEKEKGNCDFAVSMVSAEWIDKTGIIRSIKKALATSLDKIASSEFVNSSRLTLKGSDTTQNLQIQTSLKILLDGGLKAPDEYINQETVIKGDELHPVISCASIIAKVARDNVMIKYSKEYKEYGFENHVGYGTKAHYKAIKDNGLTSIHRKTFVS